MFLVEINYLVPIEVVEKHTIPHRAWLDVEISCGNILLAGPKVPRTGGIVILLSKTKAEAEELIKQDPFYINNIGKYTITEFSVTRRNELIQTLEA